MGDPWGIWGFRGGDKPIIKQIVKKIGEKNLKKRRNWKKKKNGKNQKNQIFFLLKMV